MNTLLHTPFYRYAVITVLAAAAASSSLQVDFAMGDFVLLATAHSAWMQDGWLGWLRDNTAVWGNGFWRPVLNLFFSFTYALFGLNAVYYHVLSIALHALNACLIYRLMQSRGNEKGGFYAAALFAVHPTPWQAVVWISSISDLISITFILSACLCYHRFIRQESTKFRALTLLFACAALLTKESSIIIFPLLFLIDSLDGEKVESLSPRYLIRRFRFHVYSLILLLGYLVFTLSNISVRTTDLPNYTFSPFSILDSLLRFLAWLANPYSHFHSLPMLDGLSFILLWNRIPLLQTGMGLAIATGLVVVWWRAGRQNRLLIAWLFLALLPVSVWSDYLASRYAYSACAPFCMLVGIGIGWLFNSLSHSGSSFHRFYSRVVYTILILTMALFTHSYWSTRSWFMYYRQSIMLNDLKRYVLDTIPRDMTDNVIWWLGDGEPDLVSCKGLLQILRGEITCENLAYIPTDRYDVMVAQANPNKQIFVVFEHEGVMRPLRDETGIVLQKLVPPAYVPMEIKENSAVVTDSVDRVEDLSGKSDTDSPYRRGLVIRWNIPETGIQNCHIYVSIDDREFQYFGMTKGSDMGYFNWKAGNPNIQSRFLAGPQDGFRYRFRVHAIVPGRKIPPVFTSDSVTFLLEQPDIQK